MLGTRREHARQGADLVLERHDSVGLVDRVNSRRFFRDSDLHGVKQVSVRNAFNRLGHRGGKQCGQAVFRHGRGNRFDVFSEAHAQHFVGLVEDEHAHAGQI